MPACWLSRSGGGATSARYAGRGTHHHPHPTSTSPLSRASLHILPPSRGTTGEPPLSPLRALAVKRTPPDGSTRRARKLRAEMTDAERRMWALLRTVFPDWRFRRQVPIRQYIADFASHRARLIIEVDGGQHNEEIDAPRTAVLERDGYRFVRFWNNDVLANIDGVATLLTKALDETSPQPDSSPSTGRASGKSALP